MMSGSMPTRVIEVVWQSGHAVSVWFERPEGFLYHPGQYMFITLARGGENQVRHLTISSSPTEPMLDMTKELTGHPFAGGRGDDPDRQGRVFFISGPAATVDAMTTILREMEVPEEQIRHEYFLGIEAVEPT
ncbi:hypothetical protein [Methanosphaerula palustris]|uniref:FAD-binding FR-type domain-containing protein n=1 Tax=Methanosphaerula palustris (strain ATCC BAA-1556 / DSM 19958 / E1-9c) TaxID=521011 RepID=B8GFJ3_METPE|nr:hypothetical protein [Methanosphaerula palustris]ACL16041.1 hypothetical protein Mpal_0674 [Methanosphaerula palustris E1-9c]